MRKRSLLAVVLVIFALPALADAPKANPDTLTAIADLEVDFAFDVFATPRTKAELLASARENYRKALQADPKHKDALRGLARLHVRTGERDQAIEAYKNYLRHYPTDVDARRELVKLEAERLRARFGCHSGAVGADPENWRDSPEPLPFAQGACVSSLGIAVRTQPEYVAINTVVVKVPRAFIAQSGLNAGCAPDAKSWTLSPRETRMLLAMIQRDPDRKMLAEPRVCTQDGRMACIRLGGEADPLLRVGLPIPQVRFVATGLNLELTPKVSADANSVSLTTNFQFTQGKGAATRTQTTRATETLHIGESLMLATSVVESRSLCGSLTNLSVGDPFVTLIIVTPSKATPEELAPPASVNHK